MRQTDKPFNIDKRLVYEAYKVVKSNRGAAGVDEQSIEQFAEDLAGNLYKIWNRMSSGTYFPPPVRAVPIPKKSGGERILGVPTVADRVAQMVVKQVIEPILEPIFLADSYGYRPNKSALDAVGATRERCWKYDWVLEFDIKSLFDNIDHELLLRAVRKHITCKWALLYIERWLKAPMVKEDRTTIERRCGTPQGGVVSPILANLFLHDAFDAWMERTHPDLPWCRYADDGLVHCRSEQEAKALKAELQVRLVECRLEMHPTKTRIVYCKDGHRKGQYPNIKFDFLGYCFRPRQVRRMRDNVLFGGFNPAVSSAALNTMRATVRDLNLRQQTQLSLQDIARQLNPLLRGWIGYYGRYAPSALSPLLRYVNQTLVAWAQRKFLSEDGRWTDTGILPHVSDFYRHARFAVTNKSKAHEKRSDVCGSRGLLRPTLKLRAGGSARDVPHTLPARESKISPNTSNITTVIFAKLPCEISLFRQDGDEMYCQKRYWGKQRNPKIVQDNSKPQNEECHCDIHRIATEAIRAVWDQLRCGLPWTGVLSSTPEQNQCWYEEADANRDKDNATCNAKWPADRDRQRPDRTLKNDSNEDKDQEDKRRWKADTSAALSVLPAFSNLLLYVWHVPSAQRILLDVVISLLCGELACCSLGRRCRWLNSPEQSASFELLDVWAFARL